MGSRVVLTTAEGSFVGLEQLLRDREFDVAANPLLAFSEPADWSPVDALLRGWDQVPAVALTSPRAAVALIDRASQLNIDLAAGPTLWAGGTATRAALGDQFAVRTPSQTAMGRAGRALGHAMIEAGVKDRVVFVCGEPHRDDFPDLLRASGVTVEEVVCYRSVLATPEVACDAISSANIVVVGSPRVATLLAGVRPAAAVHLVAVGPTTGDAARKSGWVPAAVADEPSSQCVADAVESAIHE
jgi:uroporphyrinogen-III synthase